MPDRHYQFNAHKVRNLPSNCFVVPKAVERQIGSPDVRLKRIRMRDLLRLGREFSEMYATGASATDRAQC